MCFYPLVSLTHLILLFLSILDLWTIACYLQLIFLSGFMLNRKQDSTIITVLWCVRRKSKEKVINQPTFLCSPLFRAWPTTNRFMVTADSKSNHANQIIKAPIFCCPTSKQQLSVTKCNQQLKAIGTIKTHQLYFLFLREPPPLLGVFPQQFWELSHIKNKKCSVNWSRSCLTKLN